MAKFTDFYSAPAVQEPIAPLAGTSTESAHPAAQPAMVIFSHEAISWVGIVLALVLLRVLYEVAQ